MRPIRRVILHCAATPDYPRTNPAFDTFGADDIRVWHMKDNGWDDIGYHRVIRKTGVQEKGRSIKDAGAHTKGQNSDSIGVCLIGTRYPTSEQLATLATVYLEFKDTYGLDYIDWYGHYEFDKRKTCPGIPMDLVRAYLRMVETAFTA